MRSAWTGPVNVGSDEMVTINELAALVMRIAGKRLRVRHIPGPLGVRGRNSDNRLIAERLGWQPTASLEAGLSRTYEWIADQVGRRSWGGTSSRPKAQPQSVTRPAAGAHD
jgi:nucleoside-diphosphate-sugar epimerase